jgi:hypothetical protein
MKQNHTLSYNALLISFFVLFSIISYAQLNGTKSIPGDYATIEAAIAQLNLQGVGSGGVTFNIAAGHTETFTSPDAGVITASGTQSDKIIFQKFGTGSNPLITAATGSGTTDGIIKITGGDFITFDGINLQENPLNTDATTQMEWGFALVKRNATAPVDGCRFITIKNCTITLNSANTSSTGIYAGNHLANSTSTLTLSDSLDVMSYCKFYNNNISNVYHGIRLIGSTNASFYDQNNEVGVDGGNNITNYGGGSTSSYGMNLEYQNNLKVANNLVNGGGPSHTGAIYGIRTGSATNANVDIYNNTVTLYQGGTSLIYAITNSSGSSGTNNTINIYNNVIENCNFPTSSTNSVWLIYNLASAFNINIYGNTIRNNTKSLGTGPMHCIYQSPTTPSTNAFIYNNRIYNNTSAGPMNGIHIAGGTNNYVYGNSLYDLRTTSSSTSVVSGILVATGSINTYIYNNFISDLKAIISTSSDVIRGVNITSSTSNSYIGLYYNTIFLNASSSGGNFGSTGVYHTNSATATTAQLDMRNNIIINISQSSGTGKTSAFRRSAVNVNLNNYSTLSNNNCFYAGTPSSRNVIFFDGTNFDQTIDDFKSRVAPRETFSFSENIPFVNATTAPYDLHIRTDVATQAESGASPVASPIAVLNDFDGDVRNTTTPDVGADEFNGIGQDITAPTISYIPLTNTTSTSNRILSDVVILDQSGINVTPGLAPRIYFKRTSDANTFIDNTALTNGWKFTESSSGSSPFSFSIDYSLLFGGTGVQGGDSIEYFIIAQDLASPSNVALSEGTLAINPTSVNLTGANFPITGTLNFYRIIYFLSGEVTIGSGGNFPSLTGNGGLFRSINENIVSGNIIAKILGDLIEPGTNALNQWVEDGSGNYTLTIIPADSNLKTIAGSYAGGLFRLNGADRVTIDGRYNGTGNFLTFINNKDTNNTATFQLISLGAGLGCSNVTIRNCNIKAGVNSVDNVFGIFSGSSSGSLSTGNAGGADFDNISIIENNISKCRVGLFIRGTSTDQMTNLVISRNLIGSDLPTEYVTNYGMYLGYADAPLVIDNEIYNMIYEVSKWAIYFSSNINNAIVSKNKIHSIKQPGTLGYNSVGIYFSSATGCFNNRIDNNMIYDLSTYGNVSMYLAGIRIAGGNNYKIYFNSISISDTIGNSASGLVSSCLYFSAATTNVDVRNNIFYNIRSGNSPKNYTIFSPNTTTFTSINNNVYWNTGNVFAYFGADLNTFHDWKTTVGQDSNSYFIDPQFNSPTDLHINSGTSPTVLESGGVFITGIDFDIDGDLRPGPSGSTNGGATAPDIGADEFDGVPSGASTFQLSVSVENGWNMVSVPGLHPVDQNVTTWWSGKDPAANVFRFQSGYQAVTTVQPGFGYWMKHLGANTYNTGDEWPAGGINIVPHDPINAAAGWNLIGGYEFLAPTSALTTNPSGLISGFVYGYTPGSGYQVASNLVPGYGYWVKLTSAGQININPGPKANFKLADLIGENAGKIIITDNAGKSYTLYVANDSKTSLDYFELPPVPFSDMFDVRYTSGRFVEELSSAIKTIQMQGVEYPVKVRVEGMTIRISDESGKVVNERIKSGEEVTISNPSVSKLNVMSDIIPDKYSLEQNYPNPFNPTTTIEFSLPEDVENVRLTIYNALGEKVAELVNGKMEAGRYRYQWNAGNVATGLYIYELKTNKFSSVKKMMLLK